MTYTSTKQSSYNPVSISKDAVQWIPPAKHPYITRDTRGHFKSPFLTWNGFRLSSLMKPLVAFSAARSPAFHGNGIIKLPLILQNTGYSYQRSTSTFQAPLNGIYFFSLSVAVPPYGTTKVRFQINGIDKVELLQTSSNHNGVNTITRSTLFKLREGDQVQVASIAGDTLYSDRDLQISFSGFLYKPLKGFHVAWSAHRSYSWLTNTENQALDPIDFDVLLVDDGANFNNATGTFTCQIPGIYYIHVNLAAFPGRKLYASLVLNNRQETKVMSSIPLLRYSIKENGIDTISSSSMVALKEGDTIYLKTSGGDAFYSDSHLQTSFTGILIKPEC